MDITEVLAALEAFGSEQTRKTYRRHGVSGPLFGVSYANFEVLKKRIKVNHELALALWDSGNHDARILACMIADPAAFDESTLVRWLGDLDYHCLTDSVAELAARGPHAADFRTKCLEMSDEKAYQIGWRLVAHAALDDANLSEETCEAWLQRIECEIATAPNWVRYTMNSAIISIGLRSEALETLAIETAQRIGPVKVDHGDTACKTPDAIAYIAKTKAHREKQQLRLATRAANRAKRC